MNGLPFEEVGPEHIPELSKWVKISAGLIIEKPQAEELAIRIKALA